MKHDCLLLLDNFLINLSLIRHKMYYGQKRVYTIIVFTSTSTPYNCLYDTPCYKTISII